MDDLVGNIPKKKEIDFLILAKKIWIQKKKVLKVTIIGGIIGVIVAFSIPKEYTTTIVLMPESQSSGLFSSMGSLAAMAGINLNPNMGDALASPDLYPDVFQSTSFLKGLFNIEVKDRKEEVDTTLYVYLKDHQNYPWWSYIFSFPRKLLGKFSSNDSQTSAKTAKPSERVMSKEEIDIINILKERLFVSSDKKSGVTTVSVTMQDSQISAYIADSLVSYFQAYIINYRTQKSRKDLLYAEKLFNESQINYYKAQKDYATFIDGNINVVSAKFRITQERLQNEANLTYSIYNQMAQQLQMAKVKVQDTTPVFTVIQPAIQPINPSRPLKKVIVAVFLFLSFVGISIWTLRKDVWDYISNNEGENS
ncbi:Wzz/FepE/Etk N-terminal domain-containing protein [Prevotella sp. 10(H)]|uniref:Wzz/FepE/Etk N-terminal domain-containing protein n=1 Tax=Prevotella sp. 10(H) TaxID=1158294 RepID=UPI0004A6F6E1|nr:Wzz/FepE/Etk N-terminal domain-containing protein [Prevotella sp. 10(H)]